MTLETEPRIQSLQAHRVPAQGKQYSRKGTGNAGTSAEPKGAEGISLQESALWLLWGTSAPNGL